MNDGHDVFRGVWVALLTPMEVDGRVALEALRAHVNRLISDGVNGFVVLGSTGEFSDLTVAEQDSVLQTVVETTTKHVPVIAGVGALGTYAACQRVESAAATGVNGVLVLPPLYWDGATLEDLGQHFLAVSEASPVPLILYDFPGGNRSLLAPSFVSDLQQKSHNIIGVKQTVHDVMAVEAMLSTIRRRGSMLAVAVGFEKLALSSMSLGSEWMISGLANFCTPLLRQLMSAVQEGQGALAIECHAAILRLSAVYSLSNPPIAAIKTAARLCGYPVTPHARSESHNNDRLETEVAGLLQECRDHSANHVKVPRI